jgi:glyoxylase-like metal-dependent hydrolase (beta-lactamase superfamily II)
MKSKVHTYTSVEPMLHVNAFIVETNDSLVIVDTTLTMTDSKNLKKKADGLAKPIAGIILTHAHPDHVAGTLNIAPNGDVPIYSLASVKKLMEETEQQKHQQWSGMFGAEWVPKWIYPNKIVAGGESVDIGGLKFQVIDLGSGGDCDANSLWLMEEERIGFLGDFIYNKNHTYMADGSVLRWVSNLERLSDQLKNYSSFYIGHGDSCDFSGLEKQKDYLLTYCSELLKATNGSAEFTEQTRKQFESKMFSKFPDYGCQFMVGLAADRVAEELKSLSH